MTYDGLEDEDDNLAGASLFQVRDDFRDEHLDDEGS